MQLDRFTRSPLFHRIFVAVVPLGIAGSAFGEPGEIDFTRDVRPILSDKCFACHGPDAHDRKADLRLDTAEGAAMDLGGYQAIVAGDHGKSEAYARMVTEDKDDLMPPPKIGKPLTADEIDILKRWIDSGATYEAHWSYTDVVKATPPEVQDPTEFVRNPIDQFVLKELAAQGLEPAPQADSRTLARRLHLDLHGLAPDPEIVSAFAANEADTAYGELVDRLIAAPAYGERLGTYWLDLVRYADSIGYHSDVPVEVSAFRDYVIAAFNENMPFDRFTTEQLAGDLLPNPTIDQRIASGYNRLLQTTEEGGAQPKEYMAIYAADRVRNASVTWLGSTIGCAQCHDHKYDPFTARDFYTFAAFFADVKEKPVGRRNPNLKLPSPEQTAELSDLRSKLQSETIDAAIAANPKLAGEIAKGQAAWEVSMAVGSNLEEGRLATLVPYKVSTSGSPHTIAEDGTLVLGVSDKAIPKENITIRAKATSDSPVSGLVLEALTDPSFVKGGLTRKGNGNFVLTRIQIFHNEKELKFNRAEADFEQKGFPAAHAIDGNGSSGWAVSGHEQKQPVDRTALFHLDPFFDVKAGDEIQVRLQHQSSHADHVIGKMRLSLATSEEANFARDVHVDAATAAVLAKAPADRSDADTKKIRQTYLDTHPDFDELRAKRSGWEKRIITIEKSLRTTLVAEALPEPRMTRILNRGDWMDETGEVVQPAVPEFLALEGVGVGEEGARATRLDLAEWIVDPRNPLAARTFVNRIWMIFMGRGLAANVTDIGGQGVPPTHPELLDYLAADFVESGWDVKRLVRQIVTSGTYQQSSRASERLLSQDPANDWLARQGRWRIDAEFVRDVALDLGGLLVDKVGGKSVKPYQPDGYWAQLNFPKREWQQDSGEKLYRRGLYVHWQRSFLHPAMLAFDAPSREECAAERPRSNIPQQALVLLNDPVFVEAARAFGTRILKEGGDTDQSRIAWAWEEALTRPAEPEEIAIIENVIADARASFAAKPAEAAQLAATGESAKPDGISEVDLAVWTTVARTLINAYETTSRF